MCVDARNNKKPPESEPNRFPGLRMTRDCGIG